MLDGPGGTGYDVPVRGCWVSRDVIVAAVYDCVKECMGFVMNFNHLICWLGIVYSVCISHIVQRCLVWGLLVVCVKFLGLFRCL